MLDFPRWKIVLVLLICAAGIALALPNVLPKGKEGSPAYGKTVNLGLDLRGGSYLLLEVDFKSYLKEQTDMLRNEIRTAFRGKKVDGQRIRYTGGLSVLGGKVVVNLSDPAVVDGVKSILRDVANGLDIEQDGNTLRVSYGEQAIKDMKRNVITQSLEIVRRRVDETGTREPDIQRQGDDRILLQVPGLKNPERLKDLLGQTAKLTFQMVDENMPYPDPGLRPVPPDDVRLPEDTKNPNPRYFVVKREVLLSGEMLADARATFSQGEPVVSFKFNGVGARKFADVTKANVGHPFAIVLDGKVISAPVIREPILGGSGQISGSFTAESANNLALLLRAGALPAPLSIVEERTVGPSLGADSIEAGKKAVAAGFVIVVIFMVLAYGLFGFFADIALVINLILLFAALSLLQATLTLPGIAGIVLTIGMAVDSNILIFERIREEIRNGRTPFSAVDNGFKQAFATIVDSNLTTLIAAVLLYQFGSGPVKGFAVTLSLGILASMFSAIMFTRLMVVVWLRRARPKNIAI